MTTRFRHLTRLLAAGTAFFYIGAFVAPPSLWASESSPQGKTQDLSVPAQHKKGAGAADHLSKKSQSSKTKSSKAKPKTDETAYPPLIIGPGDLLTISVMGFDRSLGGTTSGATGGTGGSTSGLPDNFLVDSTGKIFFPYVGSVELSGLSQIEASELLMKKLKHYLKFPQVLVVIQTSNTYNVSVMGDVNHPGQFMIRGKPDILTMMAQAGGPGPNPDMGGALLTRGTQKIHIDLGKLMNDKNYHELAPIVYPGDVIYVPQNPWPTIGEIGIFLGVITSGILVANALSHR